MSVPRFNKLKSIIKKLNVKLPLEIIDELENIEHEYGRLQSDLIDLKKVISG